MATVRKNKVGNWEAQIRRKGVPPITKTFPTKRAADAFAAEMEAKIARGKSIVSPDSFTVAEALEEYAAHIAKPVIGKDGKPVIGDDKKPVKKVDPRQMSYLNGVMLHMGKFSVGFLRSSNIKAFVEGLATTTIERPSHARKFHPLYDGAKKRVYAEASIRKFVYALKSTLDFHARKHGYTYDEHLFSEEKPKPWENVRERRLEAGEEEKILDACRKIITRDEAGNAIRKRDRKNGELYASLVKFLLETAARLQEALLADWSEFDTANRAWAIPKEHTKTKKARIVPLSLKVIDLLNSMAETTNKKGKPFGAMPKGKAVFIAWKRICKDAQVDDLGFHDLRHECISRWVVNNGSDLKIAKAAGHDVSVMQKYSNLRAREMLSFVDG